MDDKKEEQTKILKEILKWIKITRQKTLKDNSEKLFSNNKEMAVFELTDGEKSSRDIEKITGVNYKKVQSLWKKWIDANIAEPCEKYGGGRCIKLFNLADFGLKNQKINSQKEEQLIEKEPSIDFKDNLEDLNNGQ